MPTISLTKKYRNGARLSKEKLDALFNSLEVALNTTGVDQDNIQDNTFNTASFIEANTIEAPLDFSESNKLTIAANGITSGYLASQAVTNAKLIDNTISIEKRNTYANQVEVIAPDDGGEIPSDSLVRYDQSIQGSTTSSLVQQFTFDFISRGRPIVLSPTSYTGDNAYGFQYAANATSRANTLRVVISRDSSIIYDQYVGRYGTSGGFPSLHIPQLFSDIVDFPPTGTSTYTIEVSQVTGTSSIDYNLLVREL